MSDNGEVEVDAPNGAYPVLPKEVTDEIGSIKLFNKWSYEDVEIRDISLTYVLESEILPAYAEAMSCPWIGREIY
jgi:hypothetical protein